MIWWTNWWKTGNKNTGKLIQKKKKKMMKMISSSYMMKIVLRWSLKKDTK